MVRFWRHGAYLDLVILRYPMLAWTRLVYNAIMQTAVWTARRTFFKQYFLKPSVICNGMRMAHHVARAIEPYHS